MHAFVDIVTVVISPGISIYHAKLGFWEISEIFKNWTSKVLDIYKYSFSGNKHPQTGWITQSLLSIPRVEEGRKKTSINLVHI